MLVDAFYFLPKPPYFLDKSGLKVEINKPPFLQSHLTFKLFSFFRNPGNSIEPTCLIYIHKMPL